MAKAVWLCALAAVLLGGCPVDEGQSLLAAPSMDGEWRFTTTDQLDTACLLVVDGRIVELNKGCVGEYAPILWADQVVLSGNEAVWVVAVKLSNAAVGMEEGLYTIDVFAQLDGSWRGTLTVSDIARGTLLASTDVIMVRTN